MEIYSNNKIDFSKPYNSDKFKSFLQDNFLPTDYIPNAVIYNFDSDKYKYIKIITELGKVASLKLTVFEVIHSSVQDARVSLTKEMFNFMDTHNIDYALVLFINEDNPDVYRFSFIISQYIDRFGSKQISNPRRYSYLLGKDVKVRTAINELITKGRIKSIDDLSNRFSVEVLTKDFYDKISDWYACAMQYVSFSPSNTEANAKENNIIRMITRLIFIWFLKQKQIIPNEFFSEDYIKKILKNFTPGIKKEDSNSITDPITIVESSSKKKNNNDLFNNNLFNNDLDNSNNLDSPYKNEESSYYKAILQNIFFAMLNCPLLDEEDNNKDLRKFTVNRSNYGNNRLMRYKDKFKNDEAANEFLLLAKTVPFLNGGLFECLDIKQKNADNDSDNIYIDCFTESKAQHDLVVPDWLFFGGKDNVDLHDFYYSSSKRNIRVDGLIDTFNLYNFTIEENMPFDQDIALAPDLLGHVFENLLAKYNPETKVTARKSTGSFYTPKEIVNYIVDESILEYLKTEVSKELEPEYKKLLMYYASDAYIKNNPLQLNENDKEKIIKSIYNCKTLDPACGSGAFTMGMLDKLVHILKQLDNKNEHWKKLVKENTKKALDSEDNNLKDIQEAFNLDLNYPDYARKLYLIENTIYGIDIQPIAIQIAKLRCFISLLVSQKFDKTNVTEKNMYKNFGIRPLPNLETNFVSADSLIKIEKDQAQQELFSKLIANTRTELLDIRHKLFRAKTQITKENHRSKLKDKYLEFIEKLKDYNIIPIKELEILKSWEMFDYSKSAPFFDSLLMLGVENFNIVIGNPPYIQLQKDSGYLSKLYSQQEFETFHGSGDIYCLFYERGIELLKENGILCYITSKQWMRTVYGKPLRQFLSKYNPLKLIDLGSGIFESATVDTNILLIQKNENINNTNTIKCSELTNNTNLSDIKFTELSMPTNGDTWVIIKNEKTNKIKSKVEKQGKPLNRWDIDIKFGVKTGLNEITKGKEKRGVFIINEKERNNILKNCKNEDERKRTEELIRPILRGKDIKRYGIEYNNLYLITTFPAKNINIDNYVSVNTHFYNYKKELETRAGRQKWFETQNTIAYYKNFNKEKIIYPDIINLDRTHNMSFYLDNDNFFTLDTCFIITGINLGYLTAFLNSKLFKYCFINNFPKLGEKGYRLKIIFMVQIPVKDVSNLENEQYTNLVYAIQAKKKDNPKADTSNLEKQIDDMLYKHYNLTEDEIKEIETK